MVGARAMKTNYCTSKEWCGSVLKLYKDKGNAKKELREYRLAYDSTSKYAPT